MDMTNKIDWLSSESNHILVIEGHVDLELATNAFRNEGGDTFPPARHSFMRAAGVPEGENAEWWREECKSDDKGAEPVTISVIDY